MNCQYADALKALQESFVALEGCAGSLSSVLGHQVSACCCWLLFSRMLSVFHAYAFADHAP